MTNAKRTELRAAILVVINEVSAHCRKPAAGDTLEEMQELMRREEAIQKLLDAADCLKAE